MMMAVFIKEASALAALLLLTGCVSALNARNADVHAEAGYAAQRRGDWEAAARQFAQAVVNADLAHADARGRAMVSYEYGRAMGVLCRYEDAEKYLLLAKELNESAGHAPYLPLYELAVLKVKLGKNSQALVYFNQLMPMIEKENLLSTAPLGVADAHEQFGAALDATGQGARAAVQRERGRAIRAANPAARPVGAGTPYGTRCTAS
jgi:tetratricopeptide (TPR) repeat protein